MTWTPGGTSGWHRHPGPVLVDVVEGELELVWERDCTPRTYAACESFLDSGEVHTARNTSDDGCARAYAMFLDIHDGEPATVWVPPVGCCGSDVPRSRRAAARLLKRRATRASRS